MTTPYTCTLPGLPSESRGTGGCRDFNVECATLAEETINGSFRQSIPTGGATAGTILLFAGGEGKSFYADGFGIQARLMIGSLLDEGYQVFEIRWDSPWMNGVSDTDNAPTHPSTWEGEANLACRVASIVQWIHDFEHDQDDPFCGSGNSGGSAQLAYPLTHYGLDTLFATVVLTSGPPMADLRSGCWSVSPDPLRYPAEDKCLIDEAFGNPVEGDQCEELTSSYGPCQDGPDEEGDYPGMGDLLDEQSLAIDPNSELDYTYPGTVWFLWGTDDLGSAPHQQEVYFDAVVAGGTDIGGANDDRIEVEPDDPGGEVGHDLPATVEGAREIFNSLVDPSEGCVP